MPWKQLLMFVSMQSKVVHELRCFNYNTCMCCRVVQKELGVTWDVELYGELLKIGGGKER